VFSPSGQTFIFCILSQKNDTTHLLTTIIFLFFTVAMLNLGPCSMLPPHYHPNAVNYVVAVSGNTTTYMYQENGARLVTQVLTPGHATIFPRASMHMMMNTGASFFSHPSFPSHFFLTVLA
jgi:oxalate decarboxylase/phosphoglucose isomerase-like protein (cupin superfamily)